MEFPVTETLALLDSCDKPFKTDAAVQLVNKISFGFVVF